MVNVFLSGCLTMSVITVCLWGGIPTYTKVTVSRGAPILFDLSAWSLYTVIIADLIWVTIVNLEVPIKDRPHTKIYYRGGIELRIKGWNIVHGELYLKYDSLCHCGGHDYGVMINLIYFLFRIIYRRFLKTRERECQILDISLVMHQRFNYQMFVKLTKLRVESL